MSQRVSRTSLGAGILAAVVAILGVQSIAAHTRVSDAGPAVAGHAHRLPGVGGGR